MKSSSKAKETSNRADMHTSRIALPRFVLLEIKIFLGVLIYFTALLLITFLVYERQVAYMHSFQKSSLYFQEFNDAQLYGSLLCVYREFSYVYI